MSYYETYDNNVVGVNERHGQEGKFWLCANTSMNVMVKAIFLN